MQDHLFIILVEELRAAFGALRMHPRLEKTPVPLKSNINYF